MPAVRREGVANFHKIKTKSQTFKLTREVGT
jgi:hypothetical protein